MSLTSIGLRPEIESAFRAVARGTQAPGRVARVEASTVRVLFEEWQERTLLVPRRLLGQLVVGDWVVWDGARGTVEHLLPRRSVFVRRRVGKAEAAQVVAAHVDVALIVMGLDEDFSPRRLSRYLTLAHGAAIEPLVLLTKAGLVQDARVHLHEAGVAAGATPVHAVDVLAGIGVEAVRAVPRPGRTLALLGSSGAGKSTLANFLLDRTVARTSHLREDGTGRHTTTHRELHVLPQGGVLIDNPGMREVGLIGPEDGLTHTFGDVAEVARRCHFRDCQHRGEPGCAIELAIDAGELSRERVAEQSGLRAELSRVHQRAREKATGKMHAKALREILRRKGR